MHKEQTETPASKNNYNMSSKLKHSRSLSSKKEESNNIDNNKNSSLSFDKDCYYNNNYNDNYYNNNNNNDNYNLFGRDKQELSFKSKNDNFMFSYERLDNKIYISEFDNIFKSPYQDMKYSSFNSFKNKVNNHIVPIVDQITNRQINKFSFEDFADCDYINDQKNYGTKKCLSPEKHKFVEPSKQNNKVKFTFDNNSDLNACLEIKEIKPLDLKNSNNDEYLINELRKPIQKKHLNNRLVESKKSYFNILKKNKSHNKNLINYGAKVKPLKNFLNKDKNYYKDEEYNLLGQKRKYDNKIVQITDTSNKSHKSSTKESLKKHEKLISLVSKSKSSSSSSKNKRQILSKQNSVKNNSIEINTTSKESAKNSNIIIKEKGNKVLMCKCTNSKCKKSYCPCFANSTGCNKKCVCTNCLNDKYTPNKKLKQKQKSTKEVTCNCTSTNCQKGYCDCFKYNKKCSSLCKCSNCKNIDNINNDSSRNNNSEVKIDENTNEFKDGMKISDDFNFNSIIFNDKLLQ